MGKLYFEVNGGLGNQIFQISSAYAFAKNFNLKVVFDTRGCDSGNNFHSSWQLQELVELFNGEIRYEIRRSNTALLRVKRKLGDLFFKKLYVEKSLIEDIYRKGPSANKNYFFPVTENRYLVSEALRFGFNSSFEKLKDKIGRNNLHFLTEPNVLGIHLRRNDRKNTSYEIPDSWFTTQINENRSSIELIICFTDSKNDAHFLNSIGIPTKIFGEEVDPMIALLSLSEFSNIYISNSTFSFWAATLGKEKIITSPLDKNHPLRPLNDYNFKNVAS
jgi:hypothetical protein